MFYELFLGKNANEAMKVHLLGSVSSKRQNIKAFHSFLSHSASYAVIYYIFLHNPGARGGSQQAVDKIYCVHSSNPSKFASMQSVLLGQ